MFLKVVIFTRRKICLVWTLEFPIEIFFSFYFYQINDMPNPTAALVLHSSLTRDLVHGVTDMVTTSITKRKLLST